MKVKALKNLLYNGKIYSKGVVFDMDDVSVAIAEKYGKIEKIGGADEIDEGEEVAGLPAYKPKKK